LHQQDGIEFMRDAMNAPKEFGHPSLPPREAADRKRLAAERPNLGMAATWIFGSMLAAIVVVSALVTG
jgi:hypothetical protein